MIYCRREAMKQTIVGDGKESKSSKKKHKCRCTARSDKKKKKKQLYNAAGEGKYISCLGIIINIIEHFSPVLH